MVLEPSGEFNKDQLMLLDKLNLQSIIDNKNMAHAVTAQDLLRMEGIETIAPPNKAFLGQSAILNNNNT